jgi:succinate-semialdehyde dehydrogenase/glutarate-semialdehyde dehydrogenase
VLTHRGPFGKEKYIEAFVAETKKLRLGRAFEPLAPGVGPMVNEAGVQRTKEFVRDAEEKGARILCGGKRPSS